MAPSAATATERAYVALSRGRHSNEIYATRDSGWQDALAESAAHTFATRQAPTELQSVADRLLERHRSEQERRAYREKCLRDRGLQPEQERDRGLSISM